MMEGIDWAGLPVVAEMLGFHDIDRLIMSLVLIRNHQNKIGKN